MESMDEQFKEPSIIPSNFKEISSNVPCEKNASTVSQEISPTSNLTDSIVNKSNNEEFKPAPLKKKHRRGSKRSRKKYKPYSKLTWEEKKAVEERDSRRAVSIREKYMQEKGRPLAPYNTSQFLMAEHDTQEPNLYVHKTTRFSSSADDSDEVDYLSLSDEERDIEDARNFLQKDFAETYDRFHSETLHNMSKEELINEYIELENKVEDLEKELNSIKSSNKMNAYLSLQSGEINNGHSYEGKDKESLENAIEKLREENQRLNEENIRLRPVTKEALMNSKSNLV